MQNVDFESVESALLREFEKKQRHYRKRLESRQESAVVILGLLDGSRVEVPVVGDRAQLESTMKIIAARAPSAVMGFHHEHEKRFFENPSSLRSDDSTPR